MKKDGDRKDFLSKLLEQHRLGELTDAEMIVELKEKLISENGGKLYRYRSFESKHSIPEVENTYVYCAEPSTFNDPFDCKMGFDVESVMDSLVPQVLFLGVQNISKIEEGMCDAFLEKFDVEQLKKRYETNDNKNAACIEVMKENIAPMKDWIFSMCPNMDDKTRDVLDRGVDTILNTLDSQMAVFAPNGDFLLAESLEASLGQEIDADPIGKICSLSGLMDPALGNEATALENHIDTFLEEYKKKIDDIFAVSCFTTDNKNRLMWAHYAHDHKGFCIEYDLSEVDWVEKQLLFVPVEYSSKRPQMPVKEMVEILQSGDRDEMVNRRLVYDIVKTLAIKDEAWKYENEWRLLTPGSITNRERPFPFISCLYLGARCSAENKEKLLAVANKLNIPVKQMVIDRQWFDLHVKEI